VTVLLSLAFVALVVITAALVVITAGLPLAHWLRTPWRRS
jgi:hypothetical protein